MAVIAEEIQDEQVVAGVRLAFGKGQGIRQGDAEPLVGPQGKVDGRRRDHRRRDLDTLDLRLRQVMAKDQRDRPSTQSQHRYSKRSRLPDQTQHHGLGVVERQTQGIGQIQIALDPVGVAGTLIQEPEAQMALALDHHHQMAIPAVGEESAVLFQQDLADMIANTRPCSRSAMPPQQRPAVPLVA